MFIDLHAHTVNSDGIDSTEDIISKASKKDTSVVVGIVDHHGLTFKKTVQNSNVKVIAGVEISTEIGNLGNHILGYSLKFKNIQLLNEIFSTVSDGYNKRAIKIIENLREANVIVEDFEKLLKKSKSGTVYINHIAQSMCDLNDFQSASNVKKWAKDNGNLFFVKEEKYLPTSEETIDILHKCNALAIWGHPGKRFPFSSEENKQKLEKYLKIMLDYGLDGIEVFHPSHSEKQSAFLLDFADKNNLIVTGGSDYHGKGRSDDLGTITLEEKYFKQFIKALKTYDRT